jgi:CRP-like cAMP-binding protein
MTATTAQHIELLQRMPIFGAIREEALRFLLEQAHSLNVPAGSSFFRQGDVAQCMYVLESGRVTIRRSWNDFEVVLGEFGPGDCFGEMALLDLSTRSATAQAETPCQALALAPDHLLRLFETDPEQFALIQMNLGRELARRLRVTDERLFQALMGHHDSSPVRGGSAAGDPLLPMGSI